MPQERDKGIAGGRLTAIILVVALLGISSGSILIKLAGVRGVASLAIAAWRLGVASLVYVPIGLVRRRVELASRPRRDRYLCGLSALFLALHFATWITSLRMTSVASSVVLVSMSPVFVALFSRFILHERVRREMTAGIVLCIAGTVVIGWHDFVTARHALAGDLLALTGAVMIAGHLVVGRAVRRHTSTLGYVTVVYPAAALLLALTALIDGAPLTGFDARTTLLLVAVGLFPQVIGHTGFNFALRHAGAPLVALVSVGEPIGATLLAALFLGELPGAAKIGGGLLVLAGILIGGGLLGLRWHRGGRRRNCQESHR